MRFIEYRGEPPPSVTPRESQVLDLLIEGLSDKEIAHALNISHRTIREHLSRVRQRSAAAGRNRVWLAFWWMSNRQRRLQRAA